MTDDQRHEIETAVYRIAGAEAGYAYDPNDKMLKNEVQEAWLAFHRLLDRHQQPREVIYSKNIYE